MTLNTRRAFIHLLRDLNIDCVCDVGSMNGSESLEFRKALPSAQVIAFEANPFNFEQMEANPALKENRITLVQAAATNFEGTADFYVVDADYSQLSYQRGMSSLHQRDSSAVSQKKVQVNTLRLDHFLAQQTSPGSQLALWVDVEGKAFEVVEGLAGIRDRLALIHIEAETVSCIAGEQKLMPDVMALLESQGFECVGSDATPPSPQINLIFIRKNLPVNLKRKVAQRIFSGKVRRWTGSLIPRLK